MAATNVLTTASTAASSSDTPVTTDTVFGLKGIVGDARVVIYLKDDGSAYNQIGEMNTQVPACILAAGTSSQALQ